MRVVVPRLLGEEHLGGKEGKGVKPVVVHGDLWRGNYGRGYIFGGGQDEEEGHEDGDKEDGHDEGEEDEDEEVAIEQDLIFDPSSTYAHSEYELGIMRMFGGFPASFMAEYHALVPKTEPAAEYDDRVDLYMAYHQLNHWAIFGGGYRDEAIRGLGRLVRRYSGG